MKISRLASIAIVGLALTLTPVYAQRGGGGRSGGGGGSHSSSSHSSGVSHSSSSSRGSSFSSGGRSSVGSSSSGRSSYSSSPSRSSSSRTSTSGSSRSSFSGSRSSSSPSTRSSVGTPSTRSEGGSRSGQGVGRSNYSSPRSASVPERVRESAARQGGPVSRSSRMGTAPGRASADGRPGAVSNSDRKGNTTYGRPSGSPAQPEGGFARPGHPGPMPPSHRHMHPAPYFWHPHHHCLVHCHPIYWDPFIPRPYYWPGFWSYGWNYWYDYHVTNVVVVRDYMRDTYQVDLITYAFSGDYMYCLINDPDGHTYIQVYDKTDHLLAEQQVSRRYCKMEIDPENGGCWIMKKRDRDPLLFLYTEEGKLLIYEADK